jgi:CBS domain-containing protein
VAELPLDKVLGFLKKVRPFSELPGPVLKDVATSLMIEYFPEGETILLAGAVRKPFLYLVFSGVAHCFRNNGSGVVTLRYISEADHFGSETIETGTCLYNVQVKEDMICYLVKPEVFRVLKERDGAFRNYYQTLREPLAEQVCRFIDHQWEIAPPQALWDKSSSSQFKTPIRALLGREPVCCKPKTTVGEIARIMEFTGVGSVIVVEENKPVGIVTKNDLTWKILARKRGSDVPAHEIMSTDLLTMDVNESCFEASLRMVEHRCHHMLAIKGGELHGVLAQQDLILLQGANPAAVVGGVDKQTDIAGIKTCVEHMSIVQQGLLAQGGRMEDIWSLMSSFRDTLTRRLMVLAIDELRKQGKEFPVLEFCWMTFGTPGRKETLLNENFLEGFIYREPEGDGSQEDKIRRYIESLSRIVQKGLVACGLLDRWHGQVLHISESKWKEQFMPFAEGREDLNHNNLRVFDFRGLCEDDELIQGFRNRVIEAIQKRPALLSRMRAANDPTTIPECFYRDKVVKAGRLEDRLDLKQDLMAPFVSAVRLLCLEQGIEASRTRDRITALSRRGVFNEERAKDLNEIYPWLVEICLRRALGQGKPIEWTLVPNECGSEEKRLLTEAFRIVKETVKKAS